MIRESDYRGVDPDRATDRSLLWKLRQPLMPTAKAALRAWGTATASARCLPDYLIIGGKRTGSTTLARNLVRSDDVLGLYPTAEDRKGIYGFDVHYDRGTGWYRSHFPLERTRAAAARRLASPVVVGEASPWYLHHPHAPARAAALVPDAKILVVVRDPVERAYSHWRERVRQGIEPLATFDEAIEAEPERLRGEMDRMLADPSYVSLAHLNFGYLAQSHYADALRRWDACFAPDSMLVLASEAFFVDPEATLARVRDFLGLASRPTVSAAHFNRLPGKPLDGVVNKTLSANFVADQGFVKNRLSFYS